MTLGATQGQATVGVTQKSSGVLALGRMAVTLTFGLWQFPECTHFVGFFCVFRFTTKIF